MANTETLKGLFAEPAFQEKLQDIYLDDTMLPRQTERYEKAVAEFEALFGAGYAEVYSAPGRSEVGGNHTDHQHGKVLACSLNLDVIGVARRTEDGIIHIKSEGYPQDDVDLSTLDPVPAEEGKSSALIRGVAAALKTRGYEIGGFEAYTTNDVLAGGGMSSSAAFEVLVGTILNGLYNDMGIDSVTIAIAAQEAENRFFGKPSGLLDQMACSIGGLITVDFMNPKEPVMRRLDVDFADFGHSLCITDTKGSHSDLTPDYAAVPAEMKAVAAYFGKEVLRDVERNQFYSAIPELRENVGDRPVLRAIHFLEENRRVDGQVQALETGDFDEFLRLIQASGDSSFKFLQNVYSNHKLEDQAIPIALAVSEVTLGRCGACRVHGGGFAGTIQAFVPNNRVPDYRKAMDALFGEGSCYVLKVRNYGGMKVL